MRTLPLLLSFTMTVVPGSSTEPESGPSYYGTVSDSGNFANGASKDYDQGVRVEDEVSQATTEGQDVPVAGVYVHLPEPETDPVVDRWVVRQQNGQCLVSSEAGGGPELVECLTLPEGRPGTAEETPSPDPDESQEPDDGPEPIFITVTASEFAELPLQAPEVHVQPDQDWVLVNIDTIVYTSDTPQVLETELLGVPVAVRATPVEFSWDFGDGSDPIITTGPGRPYPHQTVGYSYTQAAEQRIITLRTTWSGEFQVAGQGPWIPIAGTVTTTSQSHPFAVETRHARLVGAGT